MAIRRGFKDEFEMDDHIVSEWNKNPTPKTEFVIIKT